MAPMGRRTITKDLYYTLVAAFTERPGDKIHAAKVAGVGYHFAQTGWEKGWPEKDFQPICKSAPVIRKDIKARVERELEHDDKYMLAEHERKTALDDVARAHTDEGKMVKSTRGLAAFMLTRTLRLLDKSRVIQERTENLLAEDGKGMSLDKCLTVMDRLGRLSEKAVVLAREAMAMERLFMGRPQAIVEHQIDMSGMSDEMLDQELMMVQAALVSARSRIQSGNGNSGHASHAELTDHAGNGSNGSAIED